MSGEAASAHESRGRRVADLTARLRGTAPSGTVSGVVSGFAPAVPIGLAAGFG